MLKQNNNKIGDGVVNSNKCIDFDKDKNQEISFDKVFKKKKKFMYKNKTKTIKKIKKDKILKKRETSKNTTKNIKINPDSPFAVLSNLKLKK